MQYFNPRSGERSDIILFFHRFRVCYFNPRSGERSDLSHKYIYTPPSRFQSTLRRTERLQFWTLWLYSLLFQSTLRRTERRQKCIDVTTHFEFQSTLRRTERHYHQMPDDYRTWISIHAPANGATIFPPCPLLCA